MRWVGVIVATCALAACGPSVPAERTTAIAGSKPGEREDAIERWLMAEFASVGAVSYQSSEFDLDGDGAPEVLVYASGHRLCEPGGCPLLVLTPTESGFAAVARTTATRLPIGVLDTGTNGWRDLWVTVSQGSDLTGRRKLVFDGEAYPSDATAPPAKRLHFGATHALIEESPAAA